MIYTVGETAKRLGVAPSTLRYYDKMGLLPFAERTENGVRIFKESDFEWLKVIGCLKSTGMCLKDIKSFVEMSMQGDSTVEPRLELIKMQKAQLSEKSPNCAKHSRLSSIRNGITKRPRNINRPISRGICHCRRYRKICKRPIKG